ncbi:hypothetical protein G5C51_31485 [Streptomyces sp. A7024]|uniref:Uncharacterized protein n=1 Tax=Streptomyces coryli TaxID=1128680 RepID=A0A6G4UAK1_9ACTN|nr:hypothetical protein [Streptomyces coryli]NGN68408.1 hypothetical protein [Streptomyces coryli]
MRTVTGQVVDAEVGLRRRRLHADEEGIAYGRRWLAWSEVESVAYGVTRTYVANGLFRSGAGSQWDFTVTGAGEEIAVHLDRWRADQEQDPVWSGLTRLSRRHVEPRLYTELAGRVLSGEQVVVCPAQWLVLAPDSLHGFGGRRLRPAALPWPRLGELRATDGWLHIPGCDDELPELRLPVQAANAVLVPALLPALRDALADA